MVDTNDPFVCLVGCVLPSAGISCSEHRSQFCVGLYRRETSGGTFGATFRSRWDGSGAIPGSLWLTFLGRHTLVRICLIRRGHVTRSVHVAIALSCNPSFYIPSAIELLRGTLTLHLPFLSPLPHHNSENPHRFGHIGNPTRAVLKHLAIVWLT